MDDEMFPPMAEGEDEAIDNGGDISLPEAEPDTSTEEDFNIDDFLKDSDNEGEKETPKSEEDKTSTEKKVETKEDPKEEETETEAQEKSEDADEIEFQKLLDELSANEESLEKSDEAIANIESSGEVSDKDITTLKEENSRLAEGLKRMEDQIRKLSSDKSDLMFKNAELEAFGWESTDPNMLIISRNLDKAKSGDDRSKTKVTTILKEMLSDLTGEDYDGKKVSKEADMLSAVESYNSNANPNLKSKEESEDNFMTM